MREITIISVSVIIPTKNRHDVLERTLNSIGEQNYQPYEILVIDASLDDKTFKVCNKYKMVSKSKLIYCQAIIEGAASQRSQGIDLSTTPFIFFMDDDIILYPFCIMFLWDFIQTNMEIGGVNAMITNQRYHSPGTITRIFYRMLHGKKLISYAGLCFGPAWNILPEDKEGLPIFQEVQWLNTTCTLYRKIALPNPPFTNHFKGYSLMEDLTLSLIVGRLWKLYNVRKAKIFHDSQPGAHKDDIQEMEKMELMNRFYVMTNIMGRRRILDYWKLLILELFMLLSSPKKRFSYKAWSGKFLALKDILRENFK